LEGWIIFLIALAMLVGFHMGLNLLDKMRRAALSAGPLEDDESETAEETRRV
jgi:hypothetical protein